MAIHSRILGLGGLSDLCLSGVINKYIICIGSKKDYAHESTGFPTWHCQFLLWFESEVQYMLESMGRED